MEADAIYWIWFQLLFGVGSRRGELLLHYFSHPRRIHEGIGKGGQVTAMLEPGELSARDLRMEQASDILRRTLRKGCSVVTPDDDSYPARLRLIDGYPAALYVKGDLDCLRSAPVIAMVGTRRHTEYGRAAADHLAGGLARAGAVIVSGLAPGIDTDCHKAALEAGGKTIGILGCGIDVDYPGGSREVKRAMSQNGAVVSEFPLGTQPYQSNFPLRNRIISGIAQATVVVEADLHSGSLITARLALEQGRDLFAVPGSIFSREEQGTHRLLKRGARLAETAEDILGRSPEHEDRKQPARRTEKVPVAPAAPPKVETAPRTEAPPPKRELPEGITEAGARVYARFGPDRVTVDQLSAQTGMETGEILSALTELEIYGVIQSYPGRRFGLL